VAYIKPKHYVWQAFCELAKRERITTAEAIERLQAAFPYEPVEAIVRAEGDMSQVQGQQAEPSFNDLIRQRAGATTVTLPREAITGQKGQGEYKPEDDFVRARFGERYS